MTTSDPPDEASASQTDWSMVMEAGRAGSRLSPEAWERVTRRYWPAIYAFVRRSGRDVDDAADLTQGFICDVMLGRRLLAVADPGRGRFRTLLLTALKNYLAEQHRYQSRQKRAPSSGGETGADRPGDHRAKVLHLDIDSAAAGAISSYPTPEAAFDARWGIALVHRVLERVRDECREQELSAHWVVFEARVARPMLTGAAPISYGALVERLGLKDAAQAANMMITVKRRFARAVCEEVRSTVRDDSEVDDEILELLRTLERVETGRRHRLRR